MNCQDCGCYVEDCQCPPNDEHDCSYNDDIYEPSDDYPGDDELLSDECYNEDEPCYDEDEDKSYDE